jgi:hypothetical protein
MNSTKDSFNYMPLNLRKGGHNYLEFTSENEIVLANQPFHTVFQLETFN